MDYNPSYVGLRTDLLKFIKGNQNTVLDIGCATGVNGHYLKNSKLAKRVVGLELDEEMAAEAGKVIDKVVVGNIEDDEIFKKIENEVFDFILIGDVLEHLYDPWNILLKISALLSDKGKIIISVPNIQHIELFINIYFKGEWPYNNRGIFDKTHLRWFTYKNILKLEQRSNIKIVKIERNFRFRDRIGSEFPFYGKLLKKMFPALFTFQYLVLAEKCTAKKK